MNTAAEIVNPLVYCARKTNSGSFHGLFVHASHLVCHRLISSWKADLNTSLAALELLSALARIRVNDHGQ